MNRNPQLRALVTSSYLDIAGVLLVLIICIIRNFHGTYFVDGDLVFDVPISSIFTYIGRGAYPLGIISIIGAIFSLLSTRFISKQDNSGNAIGVITSISSGVNDFLFGNRSAIITYPISFFLNGLSFAKWRKGNEIRKFDSLYLLIVIVGMILGFGLVFLGAYLFGGKTDTLFLVTVSLTFGISIGANFANAFKYEETWLSWIVYNIVQLVKNVMLLNIANVAKYIFYLFNAVISLVDWKINGDKD